MAWNLTVFEPVVPASVVGENLRTPPAEDVNVFLFCAEAPGGRNQIPAASTSRRRKARVAESKQGGGYRAGGTRFVACFRAHAPAPAGFGAGRLPPPDIPDRKPPLPRFSESRRSVSRRSFRQEFHFMPPRRPLENQNVITSRRNVNPTPPPRKSGDASRGRRRGTAAAGVRMPISRRGRIGSAFRRSEAKTLFFRRI